MQTELKIPVNVTVRWHLTEVVQKLPKYRNGVASGLGKAGTPLYEKEMNAWTDVVAGAIMATCPLQMQAAHESLPTRRDELRKKKGGNLRY